MSQQQEDLPDWLLFAREKAREATETLNTLDAEISEDIKRELEIKAAIRQQRAEIDYSLRALDQNLPPSAWNDEIVFITGSHLAGTLDAYVDISQQLCKGYSEFRPSLQQQHNILLSRFSDTSSASISGVYMSEQIERRFEVLFPDYNPVFGSVNLETIGSREQVFLELGDHLLNFDPKFGSMLRGSEEALQKTGQDHLSQAAHSMRDLFQQLMEDLAPSKVVERQPWFEYDPQAPGGVSRMSRIRYILYGSGEQYDEGEIKLLDVAAKNAKTALDLVMARTHDHDPELTEAEVQLAIDQARYSLLEVLKRYRARRI